MDGGTKRKKKQKCRKSQKEKKDQKGKLYGKYGELDKKSTPHKICSPHKKGKYAALLAQT